MAKQLAKSIPPSINARTVASTAASRNQDSKDNAQSAEIQNESKLVFNRYSEQFFLSRVWLAGYRSGEELTKTSRERSLQREMARRLGKPGTITIAARSN